MKEAGLNPAKDKPKTWDQFVDVAKKLMKVEGGTTVRNGFMCNSKEGIFNFLVLLNMMEQLGLDWGTEKGLVASMDQPDVLARGAEDLHGLRHGQQDLGPRPVRQRPLGFRHEQDRDIPDRRHLVLGSAGHLLGEAQGRGAFPVSPLRRRQGHRRRRLRLLPLRVQAGQGSRSFVPVPGCAGQPARTSSSSRATTSRA